MDITEKELLEYAVKSDVEIKRLYEQHRVLDQKISSILHRNFLTDREDVEVRTLKKEKLRGKDRLMRLLSDFRARKSAKMQ